MSELDNDLSALVVGAGPDEDEPAADPELEGVRLSRYAAVVAYLAEGIAFETAIGAEDLTTDTWARASAAWGRAIAKSAAGDGELLDAFEAHKRAGHAHVERRLPPLDEDHAAFVRFLRAFLEQRDPFGFLEAQGLTQNDVFRLQRHWTERLRVDERLQKTVADAWLDTERPLPTVRPEPARLPANPRAASPSGDSR